MMTWAATTPDDAEKWARARNRWNDKTLYVYEVELEDPELDPNYHATGLSSVMASSGRVLRLVRRIERPD